jgi:ferric-dicitrate binding protein FerR (iron transport regulator)
LATPQKNITLADDLLARYVAGTTTPNESAEVAAWLIESPENEQELDRVMAIWQTAGTLGHEPTVDVNKAWEKVQKKGSVKMQTTVQNKHLRVTFRTFDVLKIAASITLLVGFGWVLYNNFSKLEQPQSLAQYIQTNDNTLEKTLPDGTKVFLNRHSSLSYGADFDTNLRQVKLIGEAFFEVKRNEKCPFVISVGKAEVRVLGTSFNVKNSENQVQVVVESGKVQFSSSDKKVFLTKGQQAIASDTLLERVNYTPNALAYRTQIYNFDQTKLSEVVASLNQGYHAHIQFSNRVSNCQLSARFERETLKTTLAVIAETLNLKIVQKGETVWLEGAGCR